MKERQYRITVRSPYGSQALEEFRNWIGKVADEAKERWGIEISIERVGPENEDVEFGRGSEHESETDL